MSISNLSSAPSGGGAAERLTPSAENLVPGPLRLVRAPAALTEVALPAAVVEAIAAGLQAIGYVYRPCQLMRPIGRDTIRFKFGVAHNDKGVRRALLYLPDAVLTVYDRANKMALDELRETLQGDADGAPFETLYVFHDSNPNGAYKNLMSGEWRDRYGIGSKFVPVADVSGEFSEWALEAQVQYLLRELDLDNGMDAVARPGGRPAEPLQPITRISYAQIEDLSKALVKLPEFIDARGRRVLLTSAGLGEMVGRINLSDAAQTVGFDLIMRLLDPREAGNIRLLLEHLAKMEDLPIDERERVEALLTGYSFD